MSPSAVSVEHVSHTYGQRQALVDVSLEVATGEVFGFLGPNGSGKTTLFRLISTLVRLQRGRIAVFGQSVAGDTARAQRLMGVVFQAASLDRQLSVRENLWHHGHLYGLRGSELRRREDELLQTFGLRDRAHDRVQTLSGGLRRRVELTKALLHRPSLLVMDEPSAGLDPAARSDLWRYLEHLRSETGLTVVVTTHLLEEADRADRLAIMNEGRIVALDTPERLKATVGGDTITIETAAPAELAAAIQSQLGADAAVVDGRVRLERSEGHQWITRLVEAFPGRVESITLGKPTLEDVFIARTGHRMWMDTAEVAHG